MELDFTRRNEECERNHIRIGGFLRPHPCVAEITLGGGEEVIVDLHIHRLQRGHTDFCHRIQSKSRRMRIGTDEASRAEFDPAEVTYDGDGCVCNAACLDCIEDGAARCAARLAVITRTLTVSTCPEHHRVGNVTRLIVLFFYGLQPCAYLFLILCVDRIGKEARTLDFIQNRGDTALRHLPCNGCIGFHRHLFLRLK